MKTLSYDDVVTAVQGKSAAFRCVTKYQPMGGKGDKVFPPTYEGGTYAVEDRIIDGQKVSCVLLDSVQSQANRMELALLDAWRQSRISLPVMEVQFNDHRLFKQLSVTSLEAPHRVADAIFRDSLVEEDGQWMIFRKSSLGQVLDFADISNATGLFGLCPTALVFGVWDSTGPLGGLGIKFQRAMVSEVIGLNAVAGKKTSSRLDPLQIRDGAGPLYVRKDDDDQHPNWTLEETNAVTKKKKLLKFKGNGKPSEANHSNIPPQITDGGFTMETALQTTVLSLTTLRRLRFPLDGTGECHPDIDLAGRSVLTALGLVAAVLARESGLDLRSRCQLFPEEQFVWELLDLPGTPAKQFQLDGDTALSIFNTALEHARECKLPWHGHIPFKPSDELLELVLKSQQLDTQYDK